MKRTAILQDRRLAIFGPPAAGVILLAATMLLFPSQFQIADAVRRATFVAPVPADPAPPQTPAMLMQRFLEGKTLAVPELRYLLAQSTTSASADHLTAMAARIRDKGASVSTAQTTQDILASGRPEVALAFIEQQPDREQSDLWRLRFEVHRQAGDTGFAQMLLTTAATMPGSARPQDLIEAAYELGRSDLILSAAERGAIPPLNRPQSRDLAQRAAAAGQYGLIPRIDRAGTPEWRMDDPWLAMTLAQRAGDTASALRYAMLLPSGRDAAREAIIMASGDRQAIRDILIGSVQSGRASRPIVAQQLLEAGFRSEAIAMLRQEAAGRAPGEASSERLLYLMGPRPVGEDLGWLRLRAEEDRRWLPLYTEREQPARALAFVEARPFANETEALLLRIKLANAARERQAAARALSRLLDGRPLNGGELTIAASAAVPADARGRYALALARARTAAGTALPRDRMDLAWDAWNRGNARETSELLRAHLQAEPHDGTALGLMAEAEAKLHGERAARPWLERALAETPAASRERAVLLERLGRTSEAIEVVEALRRGASQNRQLDILYARLLIAAGDPGRAQKVLRP